MKSDPRRVTMLSVASIAALSLLSAPLAIELGPLDVGMHAAQAKDKGGKKGDRSGGLGGAAGDAVGAAADAAGDAVGSVADGAADAADSAGDAADSAADGVADAADSAGDAADSAADGVADAADSAGDAVDSAADGVADAADSAGDAVDAAADGVADAAETAEDAVDDVDDTAATEEDTDADAPAPDAVADVDTAAATTVVVEDAKTASRAAANATKVAARVTVSVVTMRPRHNGGSGDEKRRASSSASSTTTLVSELPADDLTALDLDAIAPSAGLVPAGSVRSMLQGCATADGKAQGSNVSCHVAGSKAELTAGQIAYAPPDAKSSTAGAAADAAPSAAVSAPAIKERTGPEIAKIDPSLPVYDEIYGLQQVEARRYADGGVPVLIVQGIVSNMSLGQRPVPPLVAIVQDERGRELVRWSFRAEADSLDPGASTGFRSEMLDPQSESAKVTIVFASDPMTAMQ